MSTTVFLSLGGNQNNTIDILKIAFRKLSFLAENNALEISSFYETPPWGFISDNNFINCVVRLQTNIEPLPFLQACNNIEHELGRIRVGKEYADRPIDIDIIYFGNTICASEKLTLPHPRMYDRNFVLLPLNEIAKHWIDPLKKLNIKQLLANCKDKSEISKVD